MPLTLEDVDNLEGAAETEEAYYTSIQRAINSMDAWKLPGRVGRAMAEALSAGRCMLGVSGCNDYYGAFIPGRAAVVPGTKGSYEFVVEHSGLEWADQMKAVE